MLSLSHSVFNTFGFATEKHSFEMNHDDAGGSLGINFTNNDDYIRSTGYMWYDVANRVTASAAYGSGDSTAGTGQWNYATVPSRPSSAPTSSSDTVLLRQFVFDGDNGELTTMSDPMGYKMKSFFDD